jgi:hypothetical protein
LFPNASTHFTCTGIRDSSRTLSPGVSIEISVMLPGITFILNDFFTQLFISCVSGKHIWNTRTLIPAIGLSISKFNNFPSKGSTVNSPVE